MSRVLTVTDICARALRVVGKFPVTDSAPDGEHKREAMHWLDLILAEAVGTDRIFSRVDKVTIDFPITNGTASYDFYATLADDTPDDRIQYIADAYLEDDNGNRCPIEMVTREKIENVSLPAETGTPVWMHLAVGDEVTPTLRIFPTPPTTDTTVWTLKLVCQLFAPNVAPGGVTGSQAQGTVAHSFGQAWQRWLIYRLALDLGSGALTKLPETSLSRFEKHIEKAEERLEGFANSDHENTKPICEPWGMDL